MPKLTKNAPHKCLLCKYCSRRGNLKRYLTVSGCPELKKVIPSDVWKKDILPYYTKDAKLPDLDEFRQKKMGRPVTPFSKVTTKRSRRDKSKVIADENSAYRHCIHSKEMPKCAYRHCMNTYLCVAMYVSRSYGSSQKKKK